MPDKAWKAFERRIATSLGTVRTPLSGKGSRHTSADTLHPDLYVECKWRKSSAICTLFRLLREDARKEHKEPVLALHRAGQQGSLAVIDWAFFLQLWDTYCNVGIESGWLDRQGIPREKE